MSDVVKQVEVLLSYMNEEACIISDESCDEGSYTLLREAWDRYHDYETQLLNLVRNSEGASQEGSGQ